MPPSEHGHDSLDVGQNYVAFSNESAEFGLNRCKDTTFQRFIQMYNSEILCKYQSIGIRRANQQVQNYTIPF